MGNTKSLNMAGSGSRVEVVLSDPKIYRGSPGFKLVSAALTSPAALLDKK
jgi:hypothetical protein